MTEAKLIIGSAAVYLSDFFNKGNCPESLIWDNDDNCARMPGEMSLFTSVAEVENGDEPNEVCVKIDNRYYSKGGVYFSISVGQALFLRDFLDTFLKLDAKLNPSG